MGPRTDGSGSGVDGLSRGRGLYAETPVQN